MKCPHCGYWNKASFPRCFSCGEPLEENASVRKASPKWTKDLKDAQVDKTYLRYDETLSQHVPQEELDPGEAVPEKQTELADSLDELNSRRRRGAQYLQNMRERARSAQEAVASAPVIRPMPEEPEQPQSSSVKEEAPETIGRRQRRRVSQYMDAIHPEEAAPSASPYDQPIRRTPRVSEPYSDPHMQPQYVFDDEDEDAPVLYDGYEQPKSEKEVGAYTDYVYPHINDGRPTSAYTSVTNQGYIRRRNRSKWPRYLAIGLVAVVLCVGLSMGLTYFIRQMTTDSIVSETQSAQITVEEKKLDGLPGHVITIAGREGAQIYIRELQRSYIVTGGVATIELPDYTFYESQENITEETMDVTLTPFLKTAEGEQVALTPVSYTIDVPLSPVTLVNPESAYATVSSSIYEIKLHVERGSRVIIDGQNVSSLITTNGNVSKNVQVRPVGDNIFQVSVRSQYCRERNMEIVLYRAPQEIPLELAGDTQSESTAKDQSMTIYGTTLPGATITIETPHTALKAIDVMPTATPFVESAAFATPTPAPTGIPAEDGVQSVVTGETGQFSFTAIFKNIGDNVITIRASYPGKQDAVITHTVYWMPDVDIYSRRAWSLNENDYTDLINNIATRKGQVYVCKGTITRILSESPQLAIMNTSTIEGGEQLVLLENNTKTIWEKGMKYRIYADAFGLYDTMPRLTARYTYVDATPTPLPEPTPAPNK